MININLNPGIGNAGMLGRGSGYGSGFQSQMMMTLLEMVSQMLNLFIGGGGLPMNSNFGNTSLGGNGLTDFLGNTPGGGYGKSRSFYLVRDNC